MCRWAPARLAYVQTMPIVADLIPRWACPWSRGNILSNCQNSISMVCAVVPGERCRHHQTTESSDDEAFLRWRFPLAPPQGIAEPAIARYRRTHPGAGSGAFCTMTRRVDVDMQCPRPGPQPGRRAGHPAHCARRQWLGETP